jgi:hypothetical protein
MAVVAGASWLYRGYQNLPALGARGLRLNPGSAVLVCFLPILNYFLGNKVLNDLWRASDPTLPVDPVTRGSNDRRRSGLHTANPGCGFAGVPLRPQAGKWQ